MTQSIIYHTSIFQISIFIFSHLLHVTIIQFFFVILSISETWLCIWLYEVNLKTKQLYILSSNTLLGP